jgi:hypothetical protein
VLAILVLSTYISLLNLLLIHYLYITYILQSERIFDHLFNPDIRILWMDLGKLNNGLYDYGILNSNMFDRNKTVNLKSTLN